MLVAKQKRKENIAEYILYLYQIEDLIRAFQSDINLISEKLVSAYKVDDKTSKEITNWYNNLVVMMDKEGIKEKGHLQFLKNLISDLNEIHIKLINSETNKTYSQTFLGISGLISELRQKNKTAQNDIELALDTIYGFLLLKMKKSDISSETVYAVKLISSWMGTLSKFFKDYEDGNLEL